MAAESCVIALRMIDLIGQESFVDGALSPALCRQEVTYQHWCV